MYNEKIIYYGKNPKNKKILSNCDITYNENIRNCWSNLQVYIKIKDWKIKDWSFFWETDIITTACATIFWESILGMKLEDVLKIDYQYIKNIIWQDIKQRKKQASILAVLTTRNAIHKYLKDWKQDDFDNLF